MRLVALLMFASWSAFATTQTSVLTSTFATANLPLDTNPASEIWANAPRVTLDRDYFGNPIPGPPTEVRSRWTKAHLYLLYICPYDELNLKPNPDISAETPRLWNWDVAEVFIGSALGAEGFARLLTHAGFAAPTHWTDPDGWFAVFWAPVA